MMQMDSDRNTTPKDRIHQLFRHYPLIESRTILHMSGTLK